MPIKGVKLCGAKCRTKNGEPCLSPGMKNGRCRMHGGVFYKREKHGRDTLRAKEQRKQERALMNEMKAINQMLDDYVKEHSGEEKGSPEVSAGEKRSLESCDVG